MTGGGERIIGKKKKKNYNIQSSSVEYHISQYFVIFET